MTASSDSIATPKVANCAAVSPAAIAIRLAASFGGMPRNSSKWLTVASSTPYSAPTSMLFARRPRALAAAAGAMRAAMPVTIRCGRPTDAPANSAIVSTGATRWPPMASTGPRCGRVNPGMSPAAYWARTWGMVTGLTRSGTGCSSLTRPEIGIRYPRVYPRSACVIGVSRMGPRSGVVNPGISPAAYCARTDAARRARTLASSASMSRAGPVPAGDAARRARTLASSCSMSMLTGLWCIPWLSASLRLALQSSQDSLRRCQ